MAKTIPKKSKGTLFDEKGRFRQTGEDICDCLTEGCEGCHFECECGSTKCGPKCRKNRNWAYDTIDYDGKNTICKKNKYSALINGK